MILVVNPLATGPIDPAAPFTAEQQPDCMQLGFLLIGEDGRIFNLLEFLLKPESWWSVKAATVKEHGISKQVASRSHNEGRRVLTLFNYLCQYADVLVAHDINRAEKILRTTCYRLDLPCGLDRIRRHDCTMAMATPIMGLSDMRLPSLEDAHQHLLGTPMSEYGPLRTLAHLWACHAVWKEIRRREATVNAAVMTA